MCIDPVTELQLARKRIEEVERQNVQNREEVWSVYGCVVFSHAHLASAGADNSYCCSFS